MPIYCPVFVAAHLPNGKTLEICFHSRKSCHFINTTTIGYRFGVNTELFEMLEVPVWVCGYLEVSEVSEDKRDIWLDFINTTNL